MTPIDLTVKAVNIKMSTQAHTRLKEIAASHGFKLQDVFSVCALFMAEDEIVRVCREQAAALGELPKSMRGMMSAIPKLTDEQKALFRKALDDA